MKELIIRAINGLILLILLFLIVSRGDMLLIVSVFIVSIIGLHELNSALNKIDIKPVKGLGYLFCLGLLMNSIGIKWAELDFIIFIFVIALLVSLVLKKDITLKDAMATVFSVLYVPFFMFHVTYLNKNIYIWLIFITAWGTDTFAYVFGNLFGKKKLCPTLSPHKTVEGSIGGIIGSIFLTYIFAKYFNLYPMSKIIVLSILCSIMSQFGDLTASRIKRITGIKDYGKIMPGHGGILDRFDSILFTSPIVYYYVKFFL